MIRLRALTMIMPEEYKGKSKIIIHAKSSQREKIEIEVSLVDYKKGIFNNNDDMLTADTNGYVDSFVSVHQAVWKELDEKRFDILILSPQHTRSRSNIRLPYINNGDIENILFSVSELPNKPMVILLNPETLELFDLPDNDTDPLGSLKIYHANNFYGGITNVAKYISQRFYKNTNLLKR